MVVWNISTSQSFILEFIGLFTHTSVPIRTETHGIYAAVALKSDHLVQNHDRLFPTMSRQFTLIFFFFTLPDKNVSVKYKRLLNKQD